MSLRPHRIRNKDVSTEEPITTPQLQDAASRDESASLDGSGPCEEAEGGPSGIAAPPAQESCASESFSAPAPPKKGWFSHTFFLVMVTFAMCMSAVNTWIGPDNRFVSHELAGEEPARQQELITKLVLRLRRAELLMDRKRISTARESLAEALLFMKENNRVLPLIASDVENSDFKTPWNPKYKALLNMYEQSQMYRQEANLMKDIDAEMISSAVLIGPTDEFYKHAAAVNRKLGDEAEAQRYRDKVDRWDLVPHQVTQWGNGLDFNQACRDLLDGNYGKAQKELERLANPLSDHADGAQRRWDQRFDHDHSIRAKAMLAILPVLEHKHSPDVDKGLNDAKEQLELLGQSDGAIRATLEALYAAMERNEVQKLQ